MSENLSGMARTRLVVCVVALCCSACDRGQPKGSGVRVSPNAVSESPGVPLQNIVSVPVRGVRDLVENSAAAMSVRQPGVLFTINDSGNDALLFAIDTT